MTDTFHMKGKKRKVTTKEADCSKRVVSKHTKGKFTERKRCGRWESFKSFVEIHMVWTGVVTECLSVTICWITLAVSLIMCTPYTYKSSILMKDISGL